MTRPRALRAIVLMVAAISACAPRPQTESRALVLIVIDTLRADRLGFMGYSKAHSPNLDALARRGTAFHDAMTPVPVTLPAVTSLLTGLRPTQHGVRDNGRFTLSHRQVTLAERFRQAGFKTAAVLASSVLSADRGLAQGFESYDDQFEGPYTIYDPSLRHLGEDMATSRRRADTVTDAAIRRVDAFGQNPFFLLVHYFDVHGFYDPPPQFKTLHPGRAYDGEVSFVDDEIGRLLRHLEKRLDATIVVVSDHGEGLEEHGEGSHGFLLYQSTLHVPVVVSGPGVPAGLVREDPISLVDLEPTLARWFGLSGKDVGERDGRVLRWNEPEGKPADLYAETMRTLVSYSWSELRALRRGTHKLIHGGDRTELFDLSQDPRENAPLEDPQRTGELLSRLESVTHGETRSDVLAALENPDPQRTRLLESLGYVGGGSEPAQDDRELPHPQDQLGGWRDNQRIRSLVRRGFSLIEDGHPASAVTLLNTVLQERPERVDALFHRGTALRLLEDDAGFERDMQTVLRLEPDHVPALANYSAWLLERDRSEEALEFLSQLALLEPDNVSVLFNLAVAALRQGDPTLAQEQFTRFLQLAPEDPRAAEVRGILEDLAKP